MTITRPFGILHAIGHAIRAAIAHYRFARTDHTADHDLSGISLVVTSRAPTSDEMNDVGCRWSDWSRIQGAQPLDPQVAWSDMKIMWAAYHRKGNEAAKQQRPA